MDSVLNTHWWIQGRDPGVGRPLLLLDQAEARRAEKKSFLETVPLPYLKVWIRHCYLVYQAFGTESLQPGKILIQTKKEEKLKDCKFAYKYSSHLAPLDLWEWKILFFFFGILSPGRTVLFYVSSEFSRFFLENGKSFLSF